MLTGMGKMEHMYCCWECKIMWPLWFLKITTKIEFSYDPAIPLLAVP